MRNKAKQDKLINIQRQCNEIAQAFASLSLDLEEIIHSESDSENSDDRRKAESVISTQIANAAKIKSEFEGIVIRSAKKSKSSNNGSIKDNAKGKKPSRVSLGPSFEIGERVKITSNYRGKRGTEGIVTKVTDVYTWIEDDTGAPFKRESQNFVRIIE